MEAATVKEAGAGLEDNEPAQDIQEWKEVECEEYMEKQ
jgi:hypothetical protein